MHWVSLGLPACNNSTHGPDQDLNRLGFWLGAAAKSRPMFVSTDAQAATIRNAHEQRGEFSAAVELRQQKQSHMGEIKRPMTPPT